MTQTTPSSAQISRGIEQEHAVLLRRGRLSSVHWIVLVLSFLVTIAAWQYSKKLVALRTEARFDVAADNIPDLVRERLEKYELALLAGVSAMRANGGDFTWDEWRTFATNLDIEVLYPGINGIGLIHQIKPEDMAAYLAGQRRTRPDYYIHPDHGKDIFQPITYIYPVEPNAQAVGLDMVHEHNRHTSLNKARDTSETQITGPIVLVQDANQTPGFLFFAPVYSTPDPATQNARRETFTGAVYAPFIVSNLIGGTLDQDQRGSMIRIRDGDQIIYDEITPQGPDYDPDALAEKQIDMALYGRDWQIDIRAGLDFRADNSPHQSAYILGAGITIDLILLSLFLTLTSANRRGLRFAEMATHAVRRDVDALRCANAELDIARLQAESASAAKASFLSTMSHEVRTPLTAISGVLMLLDRAKLPAEHDSLVQAGKQASQKLLKLLTDVLDLSRLEADAVQLWEREVPLRPILEEWGILTEGMIEILDKKIVVVSDISPDLPHSVIIDDIRLAQVMNNLIDNAVRFTDQGQITLKARALGTQRYLLSLTDTGKGIAEEDLSLIFEKFRQVDGSITRTEGGTGLGLAICHDLVKLLGGEIEVISTLGEGTTFQVTLPVAGAIGDAVQTNPAQNA